MDFKPKSPHAPGDNEFQADLIAPVAMRGQDRSPKPEPARRVTIWKGIAAVAVLVAVVVSGGWLWSYFSEGPRRSRQPDPQPVVEKRAPVVESTAGQAPPEKIDPAALAALKVDAETALGAFLEVNNPLAARGAERWAQTEFEQITQLSREADAFFMDRTFEAATEKYDSARSKAELLTGRMPAILQRLVEEGRSALERGDSIEARAKLETALLIDPRHPQALKSHKRAQTLEDVLILVLTGEQHEDDKKYALAYTDYQKAVSLDPLHEAAQNGLQRVENRIKTNRFMELISEGLAALHANDLKKARDRLLKAKSFQPNAPAVLDALKQLEQAELLSRISVLRQQALAAEQAEAWNRALEAYLAVLHLDPTVQFAAQGRQRARNHNYLMKRLHYYLNHPEVLEADERLQNALALKADLEALKNPGPKLRAGISQFEALLVKAQTPVKIVIESDDLTDVIIYKVGKLGRFSERQLDLRPGTYTVVGSRDGFQDVRQKLVIQSGAHTVRIAIRCESKI